MFRLARSCLTSLEAVQREAVLSLQSFLSTSFFPGMVVSGVTTIPPQTNRLPWVKAYAPSIWLQHNTRVSLAIVLACWDISGFFGLVVITKPPWQNTNVGNLKSPCCGISSLLFPVHQILLHPAPFLLIKQPTHISSTPGRGSTRLLTASSRWKITAFCLQLRPCPAKGRPQPAGAGTWLWQGIP